MAAGRENFIFFLCPLDGVRFNRAAASLFYKPIDIVGIYAIITAITKDIPPQHIRCGEKERYYDHLCGQCGHHENEPHGHIIVMVVFLLKKMKS